MSMRYQAGIVLPGYNALKVANAPTIGAVTVASVTSISVAFTAPADVGGGAISGYSVVSTPGGFIGTGASSPITVSGLTTGTAYTFKVWATNAYGPSPLSAASASIIPAISYINATTSGASVATSGNYKIASFNGTGSFTVNSLGSDVTEGSVVDYLVVAGGGGGGQTGGAGGGAGGMKSGTGQAVTVTSYTITVGSGGSAGNDSFPGGISGNSSSFGSLVDT